jgi:phage terminase large subunit
VPRIQLPANGWEPRPYQRKLWDYLQNGGRYAIEIAHRRWGKDDVMLHHIAVCAHERIGSYWTCLPEYLQARKALWTAVDAHTGQRRLDQAFPMALRSSTNDNEMFIRFRNGSTWQLVGSDRYNSLVGAGVAGVVFSEWALANPSAWAFIRPMIEENNGWAAFITTPRGRNSAKAMYDMAKKAPERWFAEISTINDTRALSEMQLIEARGEYIALYGDDVGRAQFEQEYLCSFNAAILGAFYGAEMAALRASGRVREFDPLPNQPVDRAWDIGVRDDTSIWWFQIIGGVPHIIDCYTNHGAGVEHYAEVCQKRGWQQGTDFVPHDAKVREWGSDRTRVESMILHNLNPRVVPNVSKLDGINASRITLRSAVFHPRCEEVGIEALEQYRREWDDERKMFAANENRDWTTHLADAFRYLALAWREQPRPEVVEDPLAKLLKQKTLNEMLEEHDAEMRADD